MGRWEKWWQISQSSGFQKPNPEEGIVNVLKLQLEEKKLFPRLALPKGSMTKWKRYVKQYGNPGDGMNVVILISLHKSAIKSALALPLQSCFRAMREEARENQITEMPFLNFSLVDTSVKWAITLFCSRSLFTLIPSSDLVITRICYAAQRWDLKYLKAAFPIPFFRDEYDLKSTFEDEEISHEGYIFDLVEKICSSLGFKSLSVIFKVNPKGEILDVRCRINEAETKQTL